MLETNNSNSLDIKYVKEESIDKLEKLFGKIVPFFNIQNLPRKPHCQSPEMGF